MKPYENPEAYWRKFIIKNIDDTEEVKTKMKVLKLQHKKSRNMIYGIPSIHWYQLH